MCDFCVKHGEGKRWYLQAKNYSLDLIRNKKQFKEMVNWLLADPRQAGKELHKLANYLRLPIVGRVISWMTTRKMQKIHFGQVLPIEDVKKVFELVDVIYGFPCICRRYLLKKDNERYCFGVGNFGADLFADIPTFGGGPERLSLADACERAEAFEKKGLLHTIWTLETPFIIGICSCRPGECVAMELTPKVKMLFKGEVLFSIDPEKCVGCRRCVETCYFDAIEYLESARRCRINAYKCYGCGLCRRICPADAVRAAERSGPMKALSRY